MKKYLPHLAIALAALSLASCNTPLPTNEDNDITIIIGNQPSPSPSGSPSPSPGCKAVARVTVGFSGAGGRTTTRVGVGEVLDVTPRASDGSEVSAECHGSTVNWTINGVSSGSLRMMGDPWTDPDTNPPPRLVPEDFDPVATALSVPATCELTGDLHGFNPHVTCSSPGSMEACAEVSSPGGRSCTTFTVNP